jgi:hypothetical protein
MCLSRGFGGVLPTVWGPSTDFDAPVPREMLFHRKDAKKSADLTTDFSDDTDKRNFQAVLFAFFASFAVKSLFLVSVSFAPSDGR